MNHKQDVSLTYQPLYCYCTHTHTHTATLTFHAWFPIPPHVYGQESAAVFAPAIYADGSGGSVVTARTAQEVHFIKKGCWQILRVCFTAETGL